MLSPTAALGGESTGPKNHFFLRGRPLLAKPLFAVAAAADLSIRKSSRPLPSLMAAAIQRGIAPLPAQVSPPGPRYLGATVVPLNALPRPRPPAPTSLPSAASCRCKSPALLLRARPTSSRNCKRASTDIEARLILAI